MFKKIYFSAPKIYAALFFLLLFQIKTPEASAQPQLVKALGVQTLEYRDESRDRPIVIELWYPTDQEAPQDTPEESLWVHPQEIRNAQIAKRETKYPLILMSHGHKGDRRERSWLANLLARQGYILASVDHYGDTRSTFTPLISLRFWERPLDLTFALDKLLEESSIQNRIDSDKIGFIGYSLGGMTGLALAGATAKNVQKILSQAIKVYKEITPEILSQIDFKTAEKSYRDPRIKTALLICPAMFVYSAESLKQISIPIGLIAAIDDEVLPYKHHAYQIIKHAIPSKLKVMNKDISHYSFLNKISEPGKKILQKQMKAERRGCKQETVHEEAGLFAIDFFKETL